MPEDEAVVSGRTIPAPRGGVGPGAAADGEPEASVSAFAADLVERQPLKGYELKKCLASGECSAVFKAKDTNMERTVAVKVLRPWPGREGAVEEFFSLAGSIARLRSSAAARGFDAGRVDGNFYMAHDFVPGTSLAARLAGRQSGRFTEREALKLVSEAARSLQELFERGNPHGRLRPTTIMLGDGGRTVFTGIGFAWNLAWATDDDAFAARPDFLPPERIDGDLNVDVRGDLYSLGAIWHLALLGEPVFKALTGRETLRLHLEQAPVPPRERDPRLSAATSNLILWLLEKDREARPRTPKEFLRKLGSHPLLAEAAATGEGQGAGAQSDAGKENAG